MKGGKSSYGKKKGGAGKTGGADVMMPVRSAKAPAPYAGSKRPKK